MDGWLGLALLIAAATGAGLIGGLFFAFSSFVMAALARLPTTDGAAAMRGINVTVLNPLFFAAFFGTGLLSLALAVLAVPRIGTAAGAATLAAASLYLFGAIGVTMAFNVPLNETLRKAADEELPTVWRRYCGPWTRWNHVRTAASLAAAVLYAVAIGVG